MDCPRQRHGHFEFELHRRPDEDRSGTPTHRTGGPTSAIFREVNRREIVDIFRKVFSGTHTGHPKVDVIKAADNLHQRRSAPTPDGRRRAPRRTPLRLKVWPRELTVLA